MPYYMFHENRKVDSEDFVPFSQTFYMQTDDSHGVALENFVYIIFLPSIYSVSKTIYSQLIFILESFKK